MILAGVQSTAAQGFSTGIGSGGAEASVVNFFNEMVFYTFEVNSVAEITLYFIAPLFGFYMINKNIFGLGFESFEERIDRQSYGRTDDDIPSGLKGLALAVAFMTVQVAGIFGTVILLVAGGLAFTAWMLNHVGLLGDWNQSRGGSGSTTSSSSGDTEDAAQQVSEAINVAEQDEEEAEQDMEQGNVEEAEDEIQEALDAFSGAEDRILEILSMDTDEMDDAILKVERASHTVGQLEKNDVATLKQLFEELDNLTRGLLNQLSDDRSAGQPDITANFTDEWADLNKNTSITSLTQRIEDEVNLIAKGEKNTNQNVKDGVDEMLDATLDLVRVLKFEDRLSDDLGRLAQDEDRLKKIIKKSGANENFIQRLLNERQQLENLKDNLQKIDSYDAEHKVAAALDKLEEYLQIEQAEQQDIKTLHKDIASNDTSSGPLDHLGYLIDGLEDHYDPHPVRDGYIDTLKQVRSEMNGPINEGLEKIETQVTVHNRHVSQAYTEIQDLIN